MMKMSYVFGAFLFVLAGLAVTPSAHADGVYCGYWLESDPGGGYEGCFVYGPVPEEPWVEGGGVDPDYHVVTPGCTVGAQEFSCHAPGYGFQCNYDIACVDNDGDPYWVDPGLTAPTLNPPDCHADLDEAYCAYE